MNGWIEITPETSLPAGLDLLALRHRDKFRPDSEQPAGWRIIDPITTARVGAICGDERRSDRNEVAWYGHNFSSSHRPSEYTHYMLLGGLELPPIPEPTAEETTRRSEARARNAEATRQLGEMIAASLERARIGANP